MFFSPHRSLAKAAVLILVILGILAYFFLSIPASSADGFLPLYEEQFTDVPQPSGESWLDMVWSLLEPVVLNFRYIMGAVAIFFIVLAGFRMVIQGEQEEVMTKQKTNLLYLFIGLAIIAIAGPLTEIFSLEKGSPFAGQEAMIERAMLFDKQVYIVITFLKYLIGSVAVLFIVRSGAKLATAGGSEEIINTEKKNLAAAALGLIMVIISHVVVKEVLFKVEYEAYYTYGEQALVTLHPERGIQEIIGIINFLVTFAAPAAVLVLVIGGVMYLAAGGQEEQINKAKKIMMSSAIGLVVIYGAFALVSSLIAGVF